MFVALAPEKLSFFHPHLPHNRLCCSVFHLMAFAIVIQFSKITTLTLRFPRIKIQLKFKLKQ